MKYRYANVSSKSVLAFASASLVVVCINIIGLTTSPMITIPNLMIILFMFISTLLSSLYIILGYKEFDLKKHKRLVKEFKRLPNRSKPSVNVFLPCAGEEISVLRRTYKGVHQIDYPKSKLSVYVLDDKGDPQIKSLAESFGFIYKSRPNKGEMKKAGNLKYGYGISRGQHILILDADFRPKSGILNETIPYMLDDPSIGIMQTPQDFVINNSESKFVQSGDIAIQEFFYRICQQGRNSFNASICTGTNALYRRSALKKAGGFYQIEHSEDSHTGLSIRNQGYNLHYLPVVLATGYCPGNYQQLYKQRSRWCQGSLTMATSKMFWKANHSFMSLISYMSGFTYYLSSFIFLIIPFNTLYILTLPHTTRVERMLYFFPNILFILFSYTNYFYPRFKFSVLGNQLFFYWVYAYTIVNKFILKGNEPWVPTGASQKKSTHYSNIVVLSVVSSLIYWFVLIYLISTSKVQFHLGESILWFWITFNLLSQISMFIGLISGSKSNSKKTYFSYRLGLATK